jgi:hypothetical protein
MGVAHGSFSLARVYGGDMTHLSDALDADAGKTQTGPAGNWISRS